MKDASIKYCIKFARSFFVADVNEADKELSAMQTRIDTLEAGIRRIINGEYDNARTILAAEKFARELLRGDE